jgi:glycosyltransferase involved in cell wall biosynthesis
MDSGKPLRIGYFNQDFPPEVGAGPARVLELSRHWTEAGAEVTVVTGMPWRRMAGRPDGEVHPDYRGKWFVQEEVDGIRVLRSWVWASPNRGFVHTLANNASYMATGTVHALCKAGPLDVIVASSPPFLAHVAGEVVRFLRRTPMVLEIRDLWPDYMVEMGVLTSRLGQRLLFGLERYLLRNTRRAVVVTESFRRRVADKGLEADRIDVIPNGVGMDRYYRDPGGELPIPKLTRHDGEFLVGYLGNFGAGQEIRTVVEAAWALRARPDIRFVLVGDGKEKPLVEERAADLSLANLSIHPPIQKDQTRAFYNACDLCLVPLAPVPIFSETVPSKIFEIMACERPVLASVAGEAAQIVRDSDAGLVTPPGDAAAMATGILAVRSLSAAERRDLGERGRKYVSEHYSREGLAARYLEILRRVSGSKPLAPQPPACRVESGCSPAAPGSPQRTDNLSH